MSDDESLSHTPPKAKKPAATKRAGSKPLADVENESHADGGPSAPTGNSGDKYQRVSCPYH